LLLWRGPDFENEIVLEALLSGELLQKASRR
jgi:hypothetical protein